MKLVKNEKKEIARDATNTLYEINLGAKTAEYWIEKEQFSQDTMSQIGLKAQ